MIFASGITSTNSFTVAPGFAVAPAARLVLVAIVRCGVAASVGNAPQRDIWLLDSASGSITRFTFGFTGFNPVWTPDGRSIVYSRQTEFTNDIVRRPITGGAEELLLAKIVNAAPTAGEGDRVHGMLSALVAAGIEGGYLTSPRLAMVHWQAGDRPLPAQRVTVSGESALWVDPAEIPSGSDIGKLGRALAAGLHGERDELMASTAAYSGLRWGELTALTIWQVDQAGHVITVDRQVIEVAGHLYVEAPKCRKHRKTIYPRCTPDGYPLAGKLAARIEQATAEHEAGTNPLGLIFLSPTGKHWRSSNFNRNVLKRAYLAIGWRDADGNGRWTWHSLRHVFCTTALFMWKLDATDVSRMAGHASYRITLDMYVGSTAGVLDRARTATD